MVEEPIKKITREEMVIAIKAMKSVKANGSTEERAGMISSSEEMGSRVIEEFYRRVLDGKKMPNEWQTSVIVPIFK